MPKENMTRSIILGLLGHEPMAGYDIKRIMSSQMSYFWKLSYGQIYPSLKSLEKDGLVTKEIQVQRDAPDRKLYSITEKGKMVLKQWLASSPKPEVYRYEILLKTFFAGQGNMRDLHRHIEQFRERNEKNYAQMKVYERQLKKMLSISDDHFFYLLTVLMGKKVYKAHLDWADEVIELLEDHGAEQE